jgi:membrane associated rhomboid family serine protease
MLFPLRDANPTRRVPVVTIALIVINVLCWFYELQISLVQAVYSYGVIPAWLLHGIRDGMIEIEGLGPTRLHQDVPHPFTVFTAMFMHGGWMHIIGNMWFLWIFGDNVEDEMGRLRYLLFYLAAGVIATLAQVVISPGSTIPMVGASGAIAGALGAYIVLHPRAKVHSLLVLIVFFTTVEVPAWLLLGVWFLSQFYISANAGVATMAHVGGFVAGAILGPLLVRRAHARAKAPPPVLPWR